MPEMTQNDTPTKSKHRKKNRESHNEVERHRKKKINSGINRIGDLIPCSAALKQSKNMILDQAFKYIHELKRQNDELLLNGGTHEQANEIKKLRKDLEDLQKENARYIELLKSNDICLYDDPTLHWKGKHSKNALVVSADQVQKTPLCLNGSHLGSNNQGAAVHGITFNVSHNLQKQTANVVPVQRTCNIVSPITGVYPLTDKAWQQGSMSVTTSSQQAPLCLPITSLSATTINVPATKGEHVVTFPASSSSPCITVTTTSQVPCSSTHGLQVQNTEEIISVSESLKCISKTAVSVCTNMCSNPQISEAPQVSVSAVNLQETPSLCQGRSSLGNTSCTEAVKHVVEDIFPSVHIESSPELPNASREMATLAGEIQVATSVTKIPNSSFENGWSLSNTLTASDLKSISGLARIPSDGNTQTTWTTLQLAGNTVQPLSQISSVIPMITEQQGGSKESLIVNQATACIKLNNPLPPEVKSVDQVMVKMASSQHVSVLSQPQPAANILPLNSPVQVIQVAQPIQPALNQTPTNQNIILLQPQNAAPCPPVLRTEVPKPTAGQQIVIIQTAPNQNSLPLMAAQPSPSVMVPLNSANPLVCPSNTMQNAVAPQTFGGKHLVHILPRPMPLATSNTTQTVPVSSTTSSQQQPTISLNGQLFALQPMTPSVGTSNQTPMQIIQPTTSEDPNTNVALNTFGALANLSQSISQMAGQSCLQFSLNPPAASLPATNIPVNCMSASGTNLSSVITDSLPTLPIAANPTQTFSAKPTSVSSLNGKAKKTVKKPSAKRPTSKKESISTNKTSKSDNMSVETTKLSNEEVQGQPENVTDTVRQEKEIVFDSHLPKLTPPDTIPETSTSTALKSSIEANVSTGTATKEQLSAGYSDSGELASSTDVSVTQSEQLPHSIESECFKACVVTSVSSLSLNDSPIQDSLIVGASVHTSVCTDESTEINGSQQCCIRDDSTTLTATDVLEAQILSEEPKEKLPSVKMLENICNKESMINNHTKEDTLVINSEVNASQQQPCVSEQEIVASTSCVTSRQTESPMSTNSGSGRNFSVASMLPDTSREVISNHSSSVSTFSGCSFTEQNDIVAVAARAIFDQESIAKGRASIQTDTGGSISGAAGAESLTNDSQNSFTTAKESLDIQVPSSNSFDSSLLNVNDRSEQKNNCTAGVSAANLSVQISTSQSQSVTSLSINNLIHQNGGSHAIVNCADVSQSSSQVTMSASANMSMSSSTYGNQSQGSSIMHEYSQGQIHSLRATVMQAPRLTQTLLKPSNESRKESNKRPAHEDVLLSTAKQQKLCQAPMRIESLAEDNQMLINHVPSNSSSVSGNSQSHGDGLGTLFPSNSSFVNSNIRQGDMRCNSQPSISDQQQAHMGSQHLQPLQQHTTSQHVSILHSNNQYLKQQQQQQQTGHLREHHLYQQHHHVSHTENSVLLQAHNVSQQRLIQQDVQMQKKRGPVQGSQSARLTLQQKHQLSEQNHQKSNQPHSHHQQMQQQMPPHFSSSQQEKSCDNSSNSRSHHGTHTQSHITQDILHQQEVGSRPQGTVVSSEHLSDHTQVQRLMTSRSLEQQMVSQPSVVSRSTNMTCSPHRQERNRVSSYSAEALIGKSTSNSEQRMGISVQGSRVSEQIEMRKYLDISRNKLSIHAMQGRLPVDHSINNDTQRLPDCQTFKPSGSNQQQPGSFDIQTSRNDRNALPSSMRVMQAQSYRITQNSNPPMDRQKHLPYQPVQDVPIASTLPIRDNENACHQSFMQSLLAPHIGEQVGTNQRSLSSHTRNAPYNSSSGIEYSCPPNRDSVHLRRDSDGQNRESCDLAMGQVNSRNNSINIPFSSSSTSGDIQGRNTSPHVTMQKSVMRPTDSQGAKNHLNIQVSINMHGVVHPSITHQSISHGNADQRQTLRHGNPLVTQRSRHPLQDEVDTKLQQPERNRTNNQRHGNMFDPSLPHLPLPGPRSMILGRQQPVPEKRPGIVRFMPDSPQVSSDNPTADQHTLTQNFGFSFIPDGTMNPPINANTSFIPPVTQTAATRTPALIPVDPQNTLPSFYPPYSPAHPSLSNDITIPYFSNQMFPNPSTEKPNSSGLNNRFGSILSPPRPVGFSQTTFPLLPEMPPMHMTNPPHLSNFNLTSLFPEIATALPADGSAMSPLLSISHSSTSDSSKQSSNRPAHNISHILGHDSGSAV
ncbi:basic helix-loop-helix domain-containing protein USF3 [Bombina bombina]|uniref:basic helix-loop-helix domain-containing protein USF3 n=1 Tax=Bombina bombina TaxID=8345 RepID=UPI00235ACD63|nr:basic helix-loop-helix domain-containing protein USF3 [Bombina bombina]XP_053561796.1 basic helix-loop-helix domain-containing protein USF3 [Bombina bombina]XP_053561797.1 basic helix-loop-helix domain-containing protein USF3 [Bombina bombina]XP_053561798.1 basic helix-loop-helix domain-containing protein USF3 [Bombina bombina]XP_053561799.1 basic helix-loop-helix domain-containing protein USF3 [Bombina bombina]